MLITAVGTPISRERARADSAASRMYLSILLMSPQILIILS
ncbi:MAG: hypothetical protein QGG56_05190 [Dehalococcoidia bacterium]|nr:hypothetical protein [Dehalococcoidia bacterium]